MKMTSPFWRPFFFLALFSLCAATSASALGNETKDILMHGQELYASGQYEKAYEAFFKAFQNKPGDPEINYNLGRAAFAKGDYEAAVMAFERVLIADPEAVQVKIELAKSFYRAGTLETAAQFFREALQADLPAEARKNIETLLAEINPGN
jgi:tetratricopeptide (TPR) repeat protein